MKNTYSPREFGTLIGRTTNTLQKWDRKVNRLMEMVELGQVRRIIIAHQDRLVRFGYDSFEAFCERHHTEIVVIND